MARAFSILTIALALLAGLPSARSADVRRTALVIGNDAYQHVPRLQRAANDADAVGDALAGLRFDVARVRDGTRAAMEQALDSFAETIGDDGIGLLFFAGQAVNVAGRDYLIAVDTPLRRPDKTVAVFEQSIPLDALVERIRQRSKGKLVLVIDACRDNPFGEGPWRVPVGKPEPSEATVWNDVFVLYAAGVGQRALETVSSQDSDPNSVFTRLFIKSAGRPGQSMTELAYELRTQVAALAAKANHQQRPAVYDQSSAPIVLVPAAR